MKILAIRGRNLASLEGDFEIDFTVEPLLSAGIFAISGPTGAGKSTLLDTMCLALFARTPRTDQAKENNVKLQDVSNEQLSFLAAAGNILRFCRSGFHGLERTPLPDTLVGGAGTRQGKRTVAESAFGSV